MEDISSCPHNYAVWITGVPRSVSSKHLVVHLMPCFSIAFPMLVDENSTSGCSSQVFFCELCSFFTPDLNASAHLVSSSLNIECTQIPPTCSLPAAHCNSSHVCSWFFYCNTCPYCPPVFSSTEQPEQLNIHIRTGQPSALNSINHCSCHIVES